MRNSLERKTVDMEARDINYMMGAYILNYLFVSKNEDPVEIIFPMFPAVPHPRKPGVLIPIKWISPTDPIAIEIAKDGSNIPEVTPEQEEVLDAKDKQAKEVKEQIAEKEEHTLTKALEGGPTAADALGLTKPTDRQPKMPASGDIGPGTHPDGMGSRDIGADRQVVKDLKEEPTIEEDKEIPTEIEKPKEE